MSTILFEQTHQTLTRELARWNRRLRLVRSALWGPRGVIVGLAGGVVVAAIARFRPWLLPEQIAWGTALFTLGLLIVLLAWLWLRPQPPHRLAQYFDRRFALKERTSTALAITHGVIPAPPALLERQLADAVDSARAVHAPSYLPIRLRWMELAVMFGLGVLFAVLLLTDNPQTSQLRAERALEQAIAGQARSLQEQLEAIDRNEALTPEEKEALRRPLEEALEILQQPEVSQQEAVAAMAAAQQELRELGDGMLGDDRATYQEAAESLAGAQATADLARAMNRADLAEAAEAAEQAAREFGQEMTQQEREDLAQRLEEAAEALSESNPALAEKLREAAEALREGDMERAQEAMREAAEAMREQQQQLQDSEMAQQAQASADSAREGQESIARAGQETASQRQAQSSEAPSSALQQGQASQSEQRPDQRGEAIQVQGSEGEPSDRQGQSGGEPGQMPQANEDQPMQEGETGSAPPSGGQTGESESGQQAGEGAPSGEESAPAPGNAPSGAQPGDNAQSSGAQESAAPSAGQGEGGAGVDTTQGLFGPQSQPGEGGGSNGETDGLRPFNPEFAPSRIGGESQTPLDVGGELTDENTVPMQEGNFVENPAGESVLNYQSVLGNYEDFVSDALESGRIPLTQRDVIHDYFSSLEP